MEMHVIYLHILLACLDPQCIVDRQCMIKERYTKDISAVEYTSKCHLTHREWLPSRNINQALTDFGRIYFPGVMSMLHYSHIVFFFIELLRFCNNQSSKQHHFEPSILHFNHS